MAAKNFYNGKIDGIWGPKTIAAKQKWERSGKFAPAIPNNGLPLDDRATLPPGVIRQANGLLTCAEVQQKQNQAQQSQQPKVGPAKVEVVQEVQSAVVVKDKDKKPQ
jgi:hypothetical protein